MQLVDRNVIEEALYDAGLDEEVLYEGYSGRAMYGDRCFGLVVSISEALKFFATLAAFVEANEITGIEVDAIAEAAKTDDMGLGMIVYFPGFELEGE